MSNQGAQPGLITISEEEWGYASQFFSDNKNVKLNKKEHSNTIMHSFIKVERMIEGQPSTEIYAIEVGDCLGQGSFGKVKLAQDRNGNNFAIKIEGRSQRNEQDSELEILKLLGEYHGESQRNDANRNKEFLGNKTSTRLYTVLNFKPGAHLGKALREARGEELETLRCAILAAEELEKLHQNRIVHGDVQLGNFMANGRGDNLTVSAIDFGFSLVIPTNEEHVIKERQLENGDPAHSSWDAPEVRDRNIRSFEGDIYSLGYMIRENPYFDELKMDPVIQDIISQMMVENYKDRMPLSKVIENLKELYVLKNDEVNDNISNNIDTLKDLIKKNFDAYFACIVPEDVGTDTFSSENINFEYIFNKYELKGYHLDDIVAAFNNAAQERGIEILFKKTKFGNGISLSNQDYDAILNHYKEPSKIEDTMDIDRRLLIDDAMDKARSLLEKDLEMFTEKFDILNKELVTYINSNNKLETLKIQYKTRVLRNEFDSFVEKSSNFRYNMRNLTEVLHNKFSIEREKISLTPSFIKKRETASETINTICNKANNALDKIAKEEEEKLKNEALTEALQEVEQQFQEGTKDISFLKTRADKLQTQILEIIQDSESQNIIESSMNIDASEKIVTQLESKMKAAKDIMQELKQIKMVMGNISSDHTPTYQIGNHPSIYSKARELHKNMENIKDAVEVDIAILKPKYENFETHYTQSSALLKTLKIQQDAFENIINNINSEQALKQKYESTKTGSNSEIKVFGTPLFQSKKRSSQMDTIQKLITNISVDTELSSLEKAQILVCLFKSAQEIIEPIHPKSRLLAVMKQYEQDILNSKIIPQTNLTQANYQKLGEHIKSLDLEGNQNINSFLNEIGNKIKVNKNEQKDTPSRLKK